jgi:hypothetical protein
MTEKTCDKCQHFRRDTMWSGGKLGDCLAMVDDLPKLSETANRVVMCLDFGSGVQVGEKFGCIHWMEKQ